MRFVFSFFLFISLSGFGQWKSYIIGVKGDTLNRIDMNGKKQGPWVIHQDELRGEEGYDEQGYFVDGKKEGLWQRFSLMGDKLADENYRWGNKNGTCRYYTMTGALLREENWRAVNPDNPIDTVDVYDLHDPSKVVDRAIVKLQGFSLKHGTWKYYDPLSGVIVKTERYWLDKPANAEGTGAAADDDLKLIGFNNKSNSDTTKKATKPKEVLEYEKKNSGKKSIKVRDGRTGY
jgi:antitoxin component YwqK of YwqJK toxin-antitoxin module